MKYLISESKLNSLIYKYLTDNFYPDYNWGPDLYDFYKKETERYGYVDFLIDDVSSYLYLLNENEKWQIPPKSLVIRSAFANKLNDLFGEFWKPVFIKWFEDNSGLDVEHLKTVE